FALSADEILSCKVYPKGFSNKAKNIVLGRGQHDSEALQKVDQLIQEFNTGGYSGLKSTEFAEALAGHLQLADSIGTDNAMDKRWAEVKYKAGESFDRATGETEEDEDISVFIAQLLCDTYPQLLGASEVNQLRGLIALAKRNGFEGIQARQQ
nr:hypothetical protein [Tanacetum cinerariifolium]